MLLILPSCTAFDEEWRREKRKKKREKRRTTIREKKEGRNELLLELVVSVV
jgi:hypothetical protein